jgi:hypothetical protein
MLFPLRVVYHCTVTFLTDTAPVLVPRAPTTVLQMGRE